MQAYKKVAKLVLLEHVLDVQHQRREVIDITPQYTGVLQLFQGLSSDPNLIAEEKLLMQLV